MAKGPIITERVKEIMAEVYLAHPDWRAKEVQYELSRRLSMNSPGLSAVQKYLTELRKRHDVKPLELRLLDEPWSIRTLIEFDIPFQAVPILLQICKRKQNLSEDPLTIRQARWIGHLHSLSQDIYVLETWSLIYSTIEKMYEIGDTKYIWDTSDLDSYVLDESVAVLRDMITGTAPISDNVNRVLRALMIQREECLGLSLEAPDFIKPNYYFEYIWILGESVKQEYSKIKSRHVGKKIKSEIKSKGELEHLKEKHAKRVLELRDSIARPSEEEAKWGAFFPIMIYDTEIVEKIIKAIKEA